MLSTTRAPGRSELVEARTEGVAMAAILDSTTAEEYLARVRAFPLVSIRDEAHLAEALAAIDQLLGRPHRSMAAEENLPALTDPVETYEKAHVAIPTGTGGRGRAHRLG